GLRATTRRRRYSCPSVAFRIDLDPAHKSGRGVVDESADRTANESHYPVKDRKGDHDDQPYHHRADATHGLAFTSRRQRRHGGPEEHEKESVDYSDDQANYAHQKGLYFGKGKPSDAYSRHFLHCLSSLVVMNR